MLRALKIAGLILLIGHVVGCNIPKDPEKSWRKIMDDDLIIGVVMTSKDSLRHSIIQKEQQLLENFAEDNHLNLQFIEGSETQLVKSLQNYKIHVLLGGFDKKSFLKKEVGMTTPYDSVHVFFVPKGENKLVYQLEKFIYSHK